MRVLAGHDRSRAIAERRPTRGELAIESPAQTAVGVLPDLLEVLGGHDAHNPRAHVVEIETCGCLKRDPAPAAEPVTDPAHVLLVACKAGEVVGDQCIPLVNASD